MIINKLKQSLREDEFRIVIRALRQNAILWRALETSALQEKIKAQSELGLARWAPAHLALTSLGISNQYIDLSNSKTLLDDEIKYKAATTLEKLLSPVFSIRQENELPAAGLAALAIRERWMMLEHMEEGFFEFIPENNPIWKMIISILYGMIPNQNELITFLLNSQKAAYPSLALHAVVSQPFSIEDQAQILFSILADQPTPQRSQTMRTIIQNYPVLAKTLACQLLDFLSGTDPDEQNSFQQLISFVERTELLKVTGRYDEVLPTLDQLNQTTTKIQADLTAQLAQAAARGKDQKTALEAIDKISELEKNIKDIDSANITLAHINTRSLSQTNFANPSETIQQEANSNPVNLLANSALAFQNGDIKKAQQFTLLVFESTIKLISNIEFNDSNPSASLTPEFLHTLLETLLAVNLVVEAVHLGQQSQKLFPNCPEIISLLGRAYELIGDLNNAVECGQIGHALSPEDREIHQQLVALLTQNGQWVEARKEAEKLVQQSEQPAPEDYTTLATCYLETSQVADAISICEKGLIDYPDYWQFHERLGRIYQKNQNYVASQNHYSNAIIIDPQAVTPWLELASLHQANNELEKALEMLLSASDVIPNNPTINLQLGILFLKTGDQIKALAAFNQAARFTTTETDVALKREIDILLGRTLYQSGYFEEAITTLENSFASHPADTEIAFLLAQALIKAKKFEEAFAPLSLTIQSDHPSSEAQLDFAYLLLELSKSPELALEYINQALVSNPDDQRATILQARATAAADDHTTAIKLFQDALRTELAQQPDYFTMLVIGIAESAFKTQQPEVAITFLQEALRQLPENLSLMQKLCQAFTQADLKHDAQELLREIKDKSTSSLQEQLWIVDQAIALKELDLAIQTLDIANQIAPQNAEIIVRLGYVQLENNQEDLARETFGQLFSAENVDITDMKMAAHALMNLGDISSSIPYLEKALELSDYQSSDLLRELTKLHIQSGNLTAALDTIQKHLQIDENLPELWFQKSQILNKIGRPKAALDAIQKALALDPKSADLHSKAATLFRQNHWLQASLEHIQNAIELDSENPNLKFQAADIYRACLRDSQAYEMIINLEDDPEDLMWLLTKAEILLETRQVKDLFAAHNVIEKVCCPENTDPKTLALQARILALQGKESEANQVFESALLNYSSSALDDLESQFKCSIEIAIGEAALILNYWDIAIFMGREVEKTIPTEPRPHLFLVKAYTTRAEYQHTCNATKTTTHAPGDVALNLHAQESFNRSLKAIYENTPGSDEASIIKKWEQRGNYALLNQSPRQDPTLLSADDFAALIAASRRTGEKFTLENVNDEWLDEDEVKFQLSLTYTETQIHNAENISAELIHSKSPSPIHLANHALMANRAGNPESASQSIKQALSHWTDEPHWHAFAAELENNRGNYSQAIDHLEHACSLERENPEHHYQLGQTYLLDHLPGNAIRALQSAASLNPLEPRYWMSLSQALKEISKFDQAMVSVEKAIKLSPTNVRPLLLSAEISYANQENKKADQTIQEALRMRPTDPVDIKIITDILIRRNKSKEALQVLDNLIDLAISPVPLLLQKANLLGITKGVQEKIKLLVQLAMDNPRNSMVLSQLASAYIENNQPTEAVRAAQYALKNDNNVLNNHEKAKLHYQLGVLFQQSGQLDQSLHHLSVAVELSPQFLEAFLDLAETLRQRREYDRAFGYLENATEISPKDPRPFLAAGLLLKDGKDYSGSESMLRKASALAPKDIFIQRQLAAVIALAIIHQSEHA